MLYLVTPERTGAGVKPMTNLPTTRADAIAQHTTAAKNKADAKAKFDTACAIRDFANADRLQAEMRLADEACREATRNRARFAF